MIPVLFDVVDSVSQVSQSLRQIDLQQILDQVREFGRKVTRHFVDSVQDLVEQLFVVAGIERHVSGHHLEQDDAQCPPVDGFTVRFYRDDFGCQILRSAAHGGRSFGDALAQSKVRQFYKTFFVD